MTLSNLCHLHCSSNIIIFKTIIINYDNLQKKIMFYDYNFKFQMWSPWCPNLISNYFQYEFEQICVWYKYVTNQGEISQILHCAPLLSLFAIDQWNQSGLKRWSMTQHIIYLLIFYTRSLCTNNHNAHHYVPDIGQWPDLTICDVTNKLFWIVGLVLEKYFLSNKNITSKPSICKLIVYKNKVHTYKGYNHIKIAKDMFIRHKILNLKNNGTHQKLWYREFSC